MSSGTIRTPACKMAQDYGFDSEKFKDASIQQLKGAKGLFIAYRPDMPLVFKGLKERAIDSDVDARFQSLLCDPYRAGK